MRMIASLPRWAGGPAALAIVALGLAPLVGVSAQSRGDLLDRIERLERRTVDLERQLYRGRRPPASATSAAPRTPARATDLELRMMQLEQELRRLTGQSEESEHGARQLAKRLDQLVGDVDVRLKELEHQVLELRQGTAPAADATASGAAAETRPPPPPARRVASPTTGASAVATSDRARRPTPVTTPVLPQGTPRDKYRFAQGLILKKSYAEAERAFRAFLEAHPDDRLAPNAHYWIGETLYIRQMYEDAARIFLTGYKRYPNSNKATDSLLKLGLTLSRMGQRDEACATFDELLARLPKTERRLRPKTLRERQNAKCP